MIVVELTQFIVVVSIVARNENIGQLGGAIIEYIFEHSGNPNVVLFPSWPQGITNKSIEKSKSGLFETL